MSVTRVLEEPRVTKPYTRRAVGSDRRARSTRSTRSSARGDVRLTMGGEPTFVAVDDLDGDEWNTAALGPTKKRLATELFDRLRERVRAEGARPLRPGQVVSGRAAAALGAQPVLAARRRAALERPGAHRRRERRRAAPTRRRAQRLLARCRRAARARSRVTSSPRTRTSTTTCGASGGSRSTSTRSTRGSTIRSSASACAALFERRARARSSAHVLPHRADEARATAWRTRPVDLPWRALLPRARRFADGPPSAARREPWIAPSDREPMRGARSRGGRAAARTPERSRSSATRADERGTADDREPKSRRVGHVDRAHGDVRRAARAASSTCSCRRSRRSTTTSRSSRAVEATAVELRRAGACSRAITPPRDPRLVAAQRDARSRASSR